MIQRKTTPIARLDVEASQLWQKAIAVMWMRTCAHCKLQTDAGAGHHIIHRRFKATKFKLMNGIYLCNRCHTWAEDNHSAFMEWLRIKWYALYVWHIENRNPTVVVRFTDELRNEIQELKQFILDNK